MLRVLTSLVGSGAIAGVLALGVWQLLTGSGVLGFVLVLVGVIAAVALWAWRWRDVAWVGEALQAFVEFLGMLR